MTNLADTGLGRILQAARGRAGLSLRELGRRSDVSQATISRLEASRSEASWSTLQKLCRALPELDAGEALGRPAGAPWPASRRTWAFHERACGFVARRITVTFDGDETGCHGTRVHLERLVPTVGSLSDPDRRVELALAAWMGPPHLLERAASAVLAEPPIDWSVRDAGVSHRLLLGVGAGPPAVTYERTEGRVEQDHADPTLPRDGSGGAPFELGGGFWLDLPARELVLVARLRGEPAERPARILAWPPSIARASPGRPSTWQHLHPEAPDAVAPGRPDAAGRRCVTLRIRHPLPGAAYGFDWSGRPSSDTGPQLLAVEGHADVGPVAPIRSIGAAVRRARTRCGLGVRELAGLAGMAPSTLSRIERGGGDPGTSTLAALLEALPDLSPWALVRPGRPRGRSTPDEIWHEQRRFFPVRSHEERRELDFDAERMSTVATTRGLVATEPVRLRTGVTRTLQAGASWELTEIRVPRRRGRRAGTEPRVRVVRDSVGPLVHDLRLGEDGPQAIDLVRRWQAALVGVNSEIRLMAGHPTDRLEAVVQLRSGTLRPAHFVTPRTVSGHRRATDRSEALGNVRWSLRVSENADRLTFVVERPIVGYRHVISLHLG